MLPSNLSFIFENIASYSTIQSPKNTVMKIKFGVHFLGIILFATACSAKIEQQDIDYELISNPEYGELQNFETPSFRFELMDSILVETPNDDLIANIESIL